MAVALPQDKMKETAITTALPAAEANDSARDALLHELANRAAPLCALAERLRDLPIPEELRPVLSALYRSSRDVERLLRSLRDPEDFFVPRLAELELTSLCGELVDSMRSAARAAGTTIFLELDRPIRVVADEVQVAEIVVNLLKNAIEATGRGGRVVVSVRGRGRVARISVRDDGPGLAPEVRAHLFRRGATTKTQGSGIGLALSRSLARAQRGRLEHRRLGRETEFTLFLRLARETPSAPANEVKPRVLVVEDDPDVRLALRYLLEDAFEVETVGDGREGLSALAAERFDALLTDQHLREGPHGDALAREACRLQPWLRGRILIVTGDSRAIAPLQSGARLVRKPFNGPSLRRALREGLAAPAHP
jgi:two-component system NtrC family sensor kinase